MKPRYYLARWLAGSLQYSSDYYTSLQKAEKARNMCVNPYQLQWLDVGKEYECVERYNKVHILGVGIVVSKEIFNEHFEIKKEQ